MSRFKVWFTKFSLVLVVCGMLVLIGCNGDVTPEPKPGITKFDPQKGPEGTEVVIEGENFNAAAAKNTVKFAGVAVPTADITVDSATRLKAKVPPGARTGLISVTTPGGTASSKENFEVIPGAGVEWTFLIYLDADNNLETAGINDFQEMAKTGSSSRVNIVVQMDRHPGTTPPYYTGFFGGWDGTRRFLVKKDDDPSVTPLQDLGEKNMGDPEVLRDFVEWGVKNYPAKHYALVIWNHGDGWRGNMLKMQQLMLKIKDARSERGQEGGISKAIASDDTDNDVLYMKEVQEALESAVTNLKGNNGFEKFDIIGFDACLMGMVEVAYAMRNVTHYMVGSEDLEPGDGWPYDLILKELTSVQSVTPDKLARIIVTEYVNSYRGRIGITQGAVDISKLNALVTAIDAFTAKANAEWSGLKEARKNTEEFNRMTFSTWGVDLRDFADKVFNQVTSVDLKGVALDLRNAVDDFVIIEGHSSDLPGSNGVSIYFPPDQRRFDQDPDHYGYEETNTFMPVDFVKFSRWDNWLKDFYSNI
ncbi:MAG: hypothetical protein GTO45_12660 [Candidatus Aminicenantes bacterium]|nr:hypothetical protein [Candidatus Aminicenantes bacterium]NIM79636.1 hypothetical protein [Candidatus Aminicenantes bacterium]NIN18962.1 hypothetical protein [Candidatus Aminicenantes bacterium]NIN42864.1 hypothetical protein [Candidatus Aminicenantes bacterium]NIN85601.1 hypothetical protein [Candidatus Aminicenantes bacterium]